MIILLSGFTGFAQKLYLRYDSASASVELKWFLKDFVWDSGVDIWKKQSGDTWQKLEMPSFKFNAGENAAFEKQHPEFRTELRLCNLPKPKSSIAFLQVLKAALVSNEFAKHLNIYWRDKDVIAASSYHYRICKAGTTLVVLEDSLTTAATAQVAQPRIIKDSLLSSNVQLYWKVSPAQFWSVLVYKRSDTGSVKCVTPYPLLLQTDSSQKGPSFSDNITNTGGTFYYSLRGLSYFGDTSRFSEERKIVVPDRRVPLPAELKLMGIKSNSIALEITQEKTIPLRHIELERTCKNDTDFTKRIELNAVDAALLYEDTVFSYHAYAYRCKTVARNGQVVYSKVMYVDVPDREAPRRPEHLLVKSDTGKIILSWKPNHEQDLWGYYVYRSILDTSAGGFVRITPEPIADTLFEDQVPKNTKTKLVYKLKAVDKDLNLSAATAPVCVQLPDVTAPQAVALTKLEVRDSTLYLHWQPNSEPDLMRYLLSLLDTALGEPLNYEAGSPDFTKTLVLRSNKTYHLTMYALDSCGNKSEPTPSYFFRTESAAVSAKTAAVSCKGKYAISQSCAQLKWKVNAEEQALVYCVYRRSRQQQNFELISGALSQLQFVDHDVLPNQLYFYQIRAYDRQGAIFKSNELELSTHEKKRKKHKTP